MLSPELSQLLQLVVARAYVSTVENIVDGYLLQQKNKIFRSADDIEKEKRLRNALEELTRKKIYEIAPTVETISILPLDQVDADRVMQETLMESVKQTFRDLPSELEKRLESNLVSTLTENIWREISKSLKENGGGEIVFAFLFEALSRIDTNVENVKSGAREILDQLVEVSSQLSSQVQESERAKQEVKGKIEHAKQAYQRWVLQSNETFFVPGLNVRLPVDEAWDEVLMRVPFGEASPGGSVAREISRYHEWERLAESARRGSEVFDADAALIGEERLVIVGGPGSGKSTLSRRLAVRATRNGALALRVSLKRVGYLLREGNSFDSAMLTVALDGSGIDEALGKAALASPDYLIADGLDESDPNRGEMANHLTTWASGHRNCRVCVMTRPVGHTASLLPDFKHTELLPLSDNAISDFADKLIAVKVDDLTSRSHLTSEFLRAIVRNKEEKHVASIAARSPLLLSFILALFVEGKPLKNRRAQLFEDIIDLMRRSSVTDRVYSVDIDVAIAETVIEITAWHLMNFPDIDLKTLIGKVARNLEIQSGKLPLEAKTLTEKGLRFWEEHGLIERLTLGQTEAYTFIHLSLQEYLAGVYISHMTDHELRTWLLEMRREVRWRQPILLASGAGAGDRIVSLLLEVDVPTDLTSTEAMISASCLSEADDVDEKLAERVSLKLKQRLTSNIPLVAIEAGEGLRQLAPLAPEIVAEITAEAREHEHEWTRLAAFAARVGTRHITLGEIRTWLEGLRFVRIFHYAGEPAEKRISDLPEEAYDLQEFAFVASISRIFEELASDEARQEATRYLKQIGHSMTSGLLNPLAGMLSQYDSVDLIDAAFEEEFGTIGATQDGWSNSDGSSPDVVLIEAIIGAAQGSIKSEIHANRNSSTSEFTNLSILISALGFLRLGFTVFHAIAKREEEAAFQEVLRAMMVVLDLDPSELRSEADVALVKLKESDETSITSFIRNIPVNVGWERAKEANVDAAKLVRALGHPSRVVVAAAANLLLNGINHDDLRDLALQALEVDAEFTLDPVARLVLRLWRPTEAARILLDRLQRKHTPGFGHIYKALGRIVLRCEESTRGEIAKALLDGLYADEHRAALAAAEVLLALPLSNSSTLQDILKRAFNYWEERVAREDREAPARTGGTGENSFRIRVVEPDPRVTLVKLLTKLGALDTEELLSLSSGKEPGVSEQAIRSLTTDAATHPDLLKSLLTRIKEGLKPYPSATAVNLLDALLGLPANILQFFETELLGMYEAEMPVVRARIVSSLTSGWTSKETALGLAKRGIDDPVPGVRNSAVRTIRLLTTVTTLDQTVT